MHSGARWIADLISFALGYDLVRMRHFVLVKNKEVVGWLDAWRSYFPRIFLNRISNFCTERGVCVCVFFTLCVFSTRNWCFHLSSSSTTSACVCPCRWPLERRALCGHNCETETHVANTRRWFGHANCNCWKVWSIATKQRHVHIANSVIMWFVYAMPQTM